MAKNEVRVTFRAFNKEFNKAVSEMNREAKQLRQEMKLQQEQMKHTSSESQKLEIKMKNLQQQYELAQRKTRETAQQLESVKQKFGANSNEALRMENALRRAQISEQQLANKIKETGIALDKTKEKERQRTSEVTKASQKLQELKQKEEQLKATSSKLTAEYDLQRAKLGANASETDKLRLKVGHLDRQLTQAVKTTQLYEQQLEQAKVQYGANSTEVQRYQAQLLQAQTAEQKLAQEIRETNTQLRQQESALIQASTKLQMVGSNVKQTGQSMTGAFLPAAAASGYAFARMINGARDFETETRRATVLTQGNYNDVKNAILEMAKDSVYSTAEVSAAFAEMGAKGFDAAQATAALPGVLSAAAASGEDLGLVADVMTSALNSFGLEASESGRVADILAQGANQSAASVDDMGYAFKYAAPIASQLGISIEELSASVGLMVDKGMKGEQAGTTLRAAFLRLVDPPKSAREALNELGVEITDSDGKMKSLSEIIGLLNKSTEGMTDAQKAAMVSTIFGTEATSGMLSLMESGPEKIKKMTTALEESGGASKKAADEMLDGWAGSLTKMESSLDVATKSLVNSLAPAIEKVASAVEKASNAFTSLNPKTQAIIGGTAALVTVGLILATVFGLILSAVGSVIGVFGRFMPMLFGSAGQAGLLTKTLTLLRGAFTFLTGPIGIVIGVISLLVLALVKTYQEHEGFRTKVNEVWTTVTDKISSAVTTIKEFVTEIFGQVVAWWDENQESIKEGTSNAWMIIQEVINAAMIVISTIMSVMWPVIQFLIVGVWEGIKTTIKGATDLILGIINIFSSLFTGDWEGLWDGVKQLASGALQLLWGIIQLGFMGRILKVIKGFGSSAVNAFMNMVKRSKEWFDDLLTSAKSKFNSIKNSVMNPIKEAKGNVVKYISDMYTKVTGKFSDTLSSAKTKFNEIKSKIVDPVNEAKKKVEDAVNKIKGFFSGMELKLPKIQMPKLPKFTMSGSFNFNPPSVPKIGVDWFADGGLMLNPTVFGTNGNNLMVGGEAGAEAILPLNDKVLGKIGAMIAKTMQFTAPAVYVNNSLSNAQKEPAIIKLQLGRNEFETFVEDINQVNNWKQLRVSMFDGKG